MFKNFKTNIVRSPYQSFAAVLVLTLSLFLISAFFLVGLGSEKVLKYFESKPQVTIFLKDEAKAEEIESLRAKIEATGRAKKVYFVSKDEALKIYRQQNKDKPVLLEMVTAKILPASLEVSTIDLSSLKEIALLAKSEPIVEDVIFQEDVIASLENLVSTLRKVGLAIAGFLLVISVLTILIVIGIKISQRQNDIGIYKLLGASSSYIRFPLYLEGIYYGFISGIISWVISFTAILYATPFLVKFLSGIPLLPLSIVFLLELLGGLVGLGICVGFLGSFFAVSHFMRKIR